MENNATNAKKEFYTVINNFQKLLTAQDELKKASEADKLAKQKAVDEAQTTLNTSISVLQTLQNSKTLFSDLFKNWSTIKQNVDDVNLAQDELKKASEADKLTKQKAADEAQKKLDESISKHKTLQDSKTSFSDLFKNWSTIKQNIDDVNSAQDSLTKVSEAEKPAKQKTVDDKLSKFHDGLKSFAFKAKDEYDDFMKVVSDKFQQTFDELKNIFSSFKDQQIKVNSAQDALTKASEAEKPAKEKTLANDKKSLESLKSNYINKQQELNKLSSKNFKLISTSNQSN